MARVESFYRKKSPATHLPYRVRTLGRIRGQPFHSTRGTYNNDAMLTVFLSGRGIYTRGRRQLPIRQGMVGIVLPGVDTGLLVADSEDPYDHLYCRFGGQLALETVELFVHRMTSNHDDAQTLSSVSRGKAKSMAKAGVCFVYLPTFQEIAGTLLRGLEYGPLPFSPPTDHLTRHDAMLAEAIALLNQEEALADHGLTPDRLTRYFHDHIAEPIQMDKAAQAFGVSRSTLGRRSREWLDQSFQQAWEQVKLNWTCTLLRESTLSVGEIAKRVGYDPFYLSRLFTRRFGVAPSHWRELHVKEAG